MNYTKEEIINAIKSASEKIGRRPSRSEFHQITGITEFHVLKYFENWSCALEASGFEPDTSRVKINDTTLLEDWGNVVRKLKMIPTRTQYRHNGKYSTGSFEKHFGPWSLMPDKFKEFAKEKEEWQDVLSLLPAKNSSFSPRIIPQSDASSPEIKSNLKPNVHQKLNDRYVFGNPIDFRGLRHEPVNENGVIFLFGIVARELGYLVEGVQAGFPDCEAKRQISAGKWQRVRIEFEYESRNFREHGHSPDGCDIIICWRDNWTECPSNIEVVELSSVIHQLAKSDE